MPVRKRIFLSYIVLVSSVTLVAQSVPGVTLERNVNMKTRDGITLVADVYRPADGQKHPVFAYPNALQQGQRSSDGHVGRTPGLYCRHSGHPRPIQF